MTTQVDILRALNKIDGMKKIDIYHKRIIDWLKNIANCDDVSFSMRQFWAYVWLDHPQKLANKLEQLEEGWYIQKDIDGIYRVLKDYIDELLNIPFYGWAQCGNDGKSILSEKPKDYLQFDNEMLGINENEDTSFYFFTKARWSSMLPIIKENDLVLIKAEPYETDTWKLYLVIHNGISKIKKVQSFDDRHVLVSINESIHQPLEINPIDDEVKVVGVVKKVLTSY